MRKMKKTLSIFMAALFVMAGFLGNVVAKAAVIVPTINYVGVSHSPLVVGDTEVFTVTSNYEGEVQYRAFLYNGTKWSELTEGYGEAVDAKTPYVLPETEAFKLGKAQLSVWVKRADETGIKSNKNGDFDNYYVANLNCVSRDDANRVYANGEAQVETDGLTVNFNGIENIGGIEGPYLYRLHIYNPTTGVWTNRVTEYTETPSYTFEEAGTYMVVAHAITENSSLWKNYEAETDKSVANQGKTYGTYEAWKTVMVTVEEPVVNPTVNVFDTTVKASTTGFGEIVNVTMTAEGTTMFANAAKYQIFEGSKAKSAIVELGKNTTALLTKAENHKAIVNILDANDKLVKAIEVVLGESGTVTVTAPVDPSTVEVNATVKASATGFGVLVTVTSTLEGAVKYQVLDGEKVVSATVELGKTTTVLAKKVAGDKVNVKLIDAAGTVISTSEVVLAAAN
jgi:hypothetical protein